MSDTVKLIVTLNKGQYENLKNIHCSSLGSRMIVNAVMNGILLDDVKAEIVALPKTYPFVNHIDTYVKEDDVLQILDNIGKADMMC